MEIKLFNKYDIAGIRVGDPGLRSYLSLSPVIIPRTSGRNAKKRFYKNKYNVIERLMNHLMVPGHRGKKHFITSGHCGGKSLTAIKIVRETLNVIEQRTRLNPIQVLVKAIENAAPREEITTIEYGGARYPQAVDSSPQRRIDVALRVLVQGAYSKSFGKKNKVHESLAEEILRAYELDNKSTAITKKLEFEKQADAAR